MNRLQSFGEGLILLVFSVALSTLTVYGALGVDPSTLNTPNALRESMPAHRQQ